MEVTESVFLLPESSSCITKQKKVQVVIDGNYIVVYQASRSKKIHEIALNEVIAVSPSISPQLVGSSNLVCIWTYRKVKAKPVRGYKWKLKKLNFEFESAQSAENWSQSIKSAIPFRSQRPKNLLVFINPYGGKRRAVKIWNGVEPIFKVAGIEVEVILTQRANHAFDYIKEAPIESLKKYDGIIAVGGDGMFREITGGLLARDILSESNIVPVGIIAAGSTDTIAFTMAGTNDPTTLSLQIIFGETQSMDIVSVEQEGNYGPRAIATNFMGFGFFGEVIHESEKLRSFGPLRYDIAGFFSFCKHHTWKASISFPENDSENENWRTINGQFICVNGANVSCKNPKSPSGVSPISKPNDGKIHLMLIKKTSRFSYLRHLIRLSKSGGHLNFNFVEQYQVKEFKMSLSKEPQPAGFWNIDGEELNSSSKHFKVMPSVIRMFSTQNTY
eukprot:c20821_g1_i2.p1 GENE.c20821_g1_i2~~c20821_g1_i2.p1  ORF type:complete len:457 (+),score=161.56 c20821_g1_i2:37-1371(+)